MLKVFSIFIISVVRIDVHKSNFSFSYFSLLHRFCELQGYVAFSLLSDSIYCPSVGFLLTCEGGGCNKKLKITM